MSFDISRLIFNPLKDYFGVVMEQGRVQLDSDWNEFLAEVARRIQAGTMDIVGLAGVPSSTPYAFRISASMDTTQTPNVPHVTIGAGRIYVDGLLAENHGLATATPSQLVWDPALAEMSATPQIPGAAPSVTDYTQQPYLPSASLTQPPVTGKCLFYLDVWQREVTFLQDRALIEKAVGIDTTGRLQTVWQVKWCDLTSNPVPVYASTPDAAIASYASLIVPSPARLTTGSGGLSTAVSGPCALSPTTGYTGMENQLYRVEIHQPGIASASIPPVMPAATGTATFKWSRDNASVSTAVTAIAASPNSVGVQASQLTLQSMGRDQTLTFQPGDWIEVTADFLELNGAPGELHRIDSLGSAANTIVLDSVVSANLVAASGQTNPSLNVRIKRWDQAGTVYLSDGTVWVNVNAAGSAGIPVPPSGTTLILESGITVKCDLDPSGNAFQTGDYWLMAARTADASVDTLTLSPPFGIHHHYCRLGVVDFTGSNPSVADCRTSFPALARQDIHVTGLFYGGTALLKDAQVAIQSLKGGLTVQFDVPLDPAILPAIVTPTTANPTPTGGNIPAAYVTVDFPGTTATGGLFTPTTIPATLSVGAPPSNTITWTPTGPGLSALTSLPIGGPPLLARLILKGESIWALDNKNMRLNGSFDGVGCSDFETWFWLIPQPTVTVSATAVNFVNPQLVGGPVSTQTVTLTNNGASALTITLTTSGNFTASGCTPTVAANSSCTITVTFNPTAQGPCSGALTVAYTTGAASGSTPVISGSVQISLTGLGIAPSVTFTPTSLPAFPITTIGVTSPQQTVTVANPGTAPLTVSAVTVAGANPGDFIVQPSNMTLPGGISANILVSFKPAAVGTRAANLEIAHNAPAPAPPSPVAIALSGTGQTAAPAVTASAPSLAFLGAGTLNVILTSTGNAPLSITNIQITGATTVFTLQSPFAVVTLVTNAQFTVGVKCTPGTATTASGSLVITHNAAGSPLTIPLSYAFRLFVDPNPIDKNLIKP